VPRVWSLLRGCRPGHPSPAPRNRRPAQSNDRRRLARPTQDLVDAIRTDRKRKKFRLDAWTWRATRIPILVVLGLFTISHLFLGSEWVFIDGVNLLLHEAGHFLWGWGNVAQQALGGTIGQLMWPAMFACYFYWYQNERFATFACVWWFGQNFMSISNYMTDAVPRRLPLIGSEQHDWEFLFKRWDVYDKSIEIARVFHIIGATIMIGSLAWLVWRTVRPDEWDVE